jgi:hypothetical protein
MSRVALDPLHMSAVYGLIVVGPATTRTSPWAGNLSLFDEDHLELNRVRLERALLARCRCHRSGMGGDTMAWHLDWRVRALKFLMPM